MISVCENKNIKNPIGITLSAIIFYLTRSQIIQSYLFKAKIINKNIFAENETDSQLKPTIKKLKSNNKF